MSAILTFLLMNTLSGVSALAIAGRVLRFTALPDALISGFIIYLAQVVASEVILGLTGRLFLPQLVLLNLIILLGVLFFTRKRQAFPFWAGKKELFIGLLNNRAALFILTVIAVFASVKVLINLFNPPFGWDALNYHFTFAVEWLKQANLDNPIVIADDPSPTYYPLNGSLFYLWLIFPFRSVFIADLGQAPFFILSFLAVYAISRKLGLERGSAFLAAGLFSLIPNFFKQLSIAYVDLMVAGLFLAALNFLFLISGKPDFKNTLLYGVSLGLLVGTKTVALPYAALLFIPFLVLCLKARQGYRLLAAAVLTIVFFGGLSYIRNWVETGNPLYPLELKFYGRQIFKGAMDSGVYRAHFKPEDYRLSKILFHEGLGLQTLIFALPAVFLALPVALLKKIKGLDSNRLYFFILPLLIYLAYRYIIPLANTRYLYPLLAAGIILGFYLARILNLPGRAINTLAVICAIASMAELAKRSELVVSFILAGLLFLASPLWMKFLPGLLKPRNAIILLLSAAVFLGIGEKYYLAYEYPRYLKMAKYSGFWPDAARAWDWLNANSKGENIAYTGRPVPFPLYGTNFKNNVYYVSVNKTDPVKLHYFPESRYSWGYDFQSLHENLEAPGNYRSGADYDIWLDNLTRRNTGYLFVYSLHQTRDILFPKEDSWAAANPAKFQPVFSNQTIHIYRIAR